MAHPRIVFLMYHELELPDRPLCQSEAGYVRYILFAHDFLAQMEGLKLANWRGVSVTSALRFQDAHSVAITFDDGCETDLLTAVPILQKLHFNFGALTRSLNGNAVFAWSPPGVSLQNFYEVERIQ